MTITPDAPAETRMIDGIPLTPKAVTTLYAEELAPKPTVEEERLRRKQKLAGALRILGRFGFGEGVAGHITVRDLRVSRLLLGQPAWLVVPPHASV